jgi:hypothetical protein
LQADGFMQAVLAQATNDLLEQFAACSHGGVGGDEEARGFGDIGSTLCGWLLVGFGAPVAARLRRAAGGCLPLFGDELLQVRPVVGPDFVAEIVEQFEDGKRLLGRPMGRDGKVDSAGVGSFHGEALAGGLAARRCLARCSARSLASLRR